MSRALDEIDVVILDRLQDDGRMTGTSLGRLVGRSVPAVRARMRRLEEDGFIAGFHAAVDFRRLSHAVTAFCWVTLRGKRDEGSFRDFAQRCEEVLELHAISESAVCVVKLRCRTHAALQEALDVMADRPGVRAVDSYVVKHTFKETRRLPVPLRGDVSMATPLPSARHGLHGNGAS